MVSTWLLIAAACFAATGFGAYIAVAACRKLMDAQQQKFEERLAQLQTQLNTVSRGAIGVGKRLIEAEQRLAATLARQSSLESTLEHQREPAPRVASTYADELVPYTAAERMLEQGASTDSLMRQCGLSQAEAELMALVHAQSGMAADKSARNTQASKKGRAAAL